MNVKFVYGLLNDSEKKAVIDLWIKAQVVSLSEALTRVNQVSCVITHDDKIVGVSTVYPGHLARVDDPYFFFRMFISPDYRGDNKVRDNVMRTNFTELKQKYGDTMQGIVLELENQKLSRLGEKSDYMNKRGYTYHGKSARGLQLWYVQFDDPKGIYQ